MKISTTYDFGPEPPEQVWEGRFFRHEGTITWRCSRCGREGSGSFKLATKKEAPTRDDYDQILVLAEVEHAVSCKGSLVYEGAQRGRYVEYSRSQVRFEKDGSPQLFIAPVGRVEHSRYEDLNMYVETKETET